MRKLWKLTKWLVLIILVLLIVGELVGRYGLGLGDPPLMMSHPDIEYMFRPNQQCSRFGNEIRYNAYSMRSDQFPLHKSEPEELRIMVLGDSIVNGGNRTDQHELSTEILKRRLEAQIDRPIVVGNISAGSWGPENLRAYVDQFGLFEADVVIIVVNSADVVDVPVFDDIVGVLANFPNEKPTSALVEGATRYLPNYLPGFLRFGATAKEFTLADVDPKFLDGPFPSHDAMEQLLGAALRINATLMVIHHAASAEVQGEYEQGFGAFAAWARQNNVAFFETRQPYLDAMDAGDSIYLDTIHLNPQGLAVLAQTMHDALEQVLPATVLSP